MQTFKLDKEKYLKLLKSQGIETALTTLHLDMNEWEFETFEGQAGYQPQAWESLTAIRAFSRELWQIALQNLPDPPDLKAETGSGSKPS